MAPAQQRLGAVDEPDFRLEIDLEFPFRIGTGQFDVEHAASLNLGDGQPFDAVRPANVSVRFS
jgi:hypothetical protein